MTILVLPSGFVPWVHEQVVKARLGSGEAGGADAPDASSEVSD
nr:hypothetical protein [Haloarcula sp. CBA1130]